MEEIKRRCRFCEKEHFGGQRVCRQCIERERERETKIECRLNDFLMQYEVWFRAWFTMYGKKASRKNETE